VTKLRRHLPCRNAVLTHPARDGVADGIWIDVLVQLGGHPHAAPGLVDLLDRASVKRDQPPFRRVLQNGRQRVESGLRGAMQPCPDPRCRLILAYLEHAAIRLRPGPGAPPGDKRARKCGVEEINRDGVVQHAPRPGRRDRPAVGAAILIEPGCHFRIALAETAGRNADPDADRIAPLGRRDRFSRIAPHSPFPFCSGYDRTARLAVSSVLGSHPGQAMVGACVASSVFPPMSVLGENISTNGWIRVMFSCCISCFENAEGRLSRNGANVIID
jgi:hypothetical protein